MKKLIYLLICTAIIMTNLCIFADANGNELFTYEIDGYEYTVEIADDNISSEKKQAIANALVGADESEIMPANIWCDIFGHDFAYTTSSVITHKVNSKPPRCKASYYDVKYCEDCDYSEQTLTGSTYIDCCPED